MKKPIIFHIRNYLDISQRRVLSTPERALNRAYESALVIRSIEAKHFNGEPIANEMSGYSDRVVAYFQAELRRNLRIIYLSLAEFRFSHFLHHSSDSNSALNYQPALTSVSSGSNSITEPFSERLKLIDQVLKQYEEKTVVDNGPSIEKNKLETRLDNNFPLLVEPIGFVERVEILSDQTGVFPKTILGLIQKVRNQFATNAETEVVSTFRKTKTRTAIALRLVLMLLFIPLLTQQISKNLVVGPIVDHFYQQNSTEIFLNADLKREALQTLQEFEEMLQFDQMAGIAPRLSEQEKITRIKDKAQELAIESRRSGASAVKNVFADILALTSFAVILRICWQDIFALKAFIDSLTHELSDSAKAFIIILFTDMFVGYHSPEGWQVMLEGLSRHIGIAANAGAISLFIATVPVMMATVFKFWIFRYLNRISPSAVATYKEMNE